MKLADGTIEEIRNVMHNLKPVGLSRNGLADSIRELCGKLKGLGNIRFICEIGDGMPRWNEAVEVNIYRIVQECLTNIVKHSGASEADVAMFPVMGNTVLIRISDNGRGFDPNTADSGLGLASMKERAGMINARIMIDSAEGKGTRVILEVPYEKNQSVSG